MVVCVSMNKCMVRFFSSVLYMLCSYVQRFGMRNADPEGFSSLARQSTSRHVDDGARNKDWHFDVVLLKEHINGKEGCLKNKYS